METKGKSREVWNRKIVKLDDKTKARYFFLMDQFLQVTGINTLEELFRIGFEESKSDDPRDRNTIENLVSEHFMWLKKNGGKKHTGIKPQSAMIFVVAVASFFKSQGLSLNINYKEFEVDESLGREVVQEKQLKQIWDSVGTENKLRNRAILAIIKDSGIRCSDVAELTIKEYKESQTIVDKYGNKFKVFSPKISEKKRKRMYIHIGYEAINAIEAYLNMRNSQSIDEPLIVNANGEKISSTSITNIVERICSKVGNNLGAHSFRKFHFTMLTGAGIPESWVLKLEGKVNSTYNKSFELGKLTEKYIEAYSVLKISKEAQFEKALEEANQKHTEELNKVWAVVGSLTKVINDPELLKIAQEGVAKFKKDRGS